MRNLAEYAGWPDTQADRHFNVVCMQQSQVLSLAAQLNVVMVGLYHFQWITSCPGLEVIKLELILRLKITRVSKQQIIALYFVSETVLRFYNLETFSEITPCNKIDKPLVVYRFSGNVMTSITTLRTL